MFLFLEFCNASTPFLMLSDVFDSVTFDKCEDVFTYVEEVVTGWKSVRKPLIIVMFTFSASKNN
jgi:hypothetical protein